MAEPTLQTRVNRILLATLALVLAVTVGSAFVYMHVKQSWENQRVADELSRSITYQVESLLPSFLLPEQRAGIELHLERVRTTEDLVSVAIINSFETLPFDFSGCRATEFPSVCLSHDARKTAVFAPIEESGKLFGYLVKIKRNSISASNDNLIEIAEVVGIVLLIAFVVLFLMLARLMSREVPHAIANLVKWIEADLSETPLEIPDLKFKELRELRRRISEIIDRHDHARDQAMIGQLTSGIMHDIKTPISSLVTATCLAEEQPKDSAKRMSRLENLLNVCRARLPVIGSIIESTLDGSRDLHVENTSRDIVDTINRAIALNSDIVQNCRAKISFLRSADSILVAHDPIQLTRVFTNLIKNAVEASSDNDKTPSLLISVDEGDQFATIAFEDNGPGLQNSDKIFRGFRSSKTHGSGLGLLISRKIVEAHFGNLTAARSKELSGARLEIRLPTKSSLQPCAGVSL